MQTRLLRAKMVEFGDDYSTLAEILGLSRQTCSVKVNGKQDFKQSEIDKIAKRYNLTAHEVVLIFFT